MKKVSVLLLLLGLFTASVSAQDAAEFGSQPGRNTTFKSNGFWDNWFIGAGAGASVFFGPEDNNADFLSRPTVNPSLYVGKWVTPYVGFRLRAQAGKIHTFAGNDAQHMESMLLGNAHVDVMWNVTNYLMKYSESRVYNFIPTLGFGYVQRDKEGAFFRKGRAGWTVNASLLNTFRLGKRTNFFVELGGYILEGPQYDRTPYAYFSHRWIPVLTASAGLQFNLGKTDFEGIRAYDQDEIDRLTGRINSLQADNAELSKRPKFCPECPKVTPCPEATTSVTVPNVVFFRIGSANIDRNQEISIYNTAQFLKSNPSAKVKIVGYADKQTGTADFNLKLSQKRAQNVAKALIDKYSISSDRVAVEWKGSTVQPYAENAWNRVAIFFAE